MCASVILFHRRGSNKLWVLVLRLKVCILIVVLIFLVVVMVFVGGAVGDGGGDVDVGDDELEDGEENREGLMKVMNLFGEKLNPNLGEDLVLWYNFTIKD